MEVTAGNQLVQPLLQNPATFTVRSCLPRASSKKLLIVSENGDPTVSLLQCCTALIVKITIFLPLLQPVGYIFVHWSSLWSVFTSARAHFKIHLITKTKRTFFGQWLPIQSIPRLFGWMTLLLQVQGFAFVFADKSFCWHNSQILGVLNYPRLPWCNSVITPH